MGYNWRIVQRKYIIVNFIKHKKKTFKLIKENCLTEKKKGIFAENLFQTPNLISSEIPINHFSNWCFVGIFQEYIDN